MNKRGFLARSIVWATLVFVPIVALAQDPAKADPVKQSPKAYTVLFDNADVRVLEIRIPPGHKGQMHSHPASVITSYTACKTRFSFPNGTSVEADFKPGEVRWRDAEEHAPENIGSAECHVLQVELKNAKTPPARTAPAPAKPAKAPEKTPAKKG